MKPLVAGFALLATFAAATGSAQTPPFAVAKCDAGAIALSNVRLPQAVLADGRPLPAGTYQVRSTTERPAPAVGQSATGECWVEFLKDGAAAGREIASVVSGEDIGVVAKGPAPKPNTARVDLLKGRDYVRVWLNSAGTHYIINLPVSMTTSESP
jgi:hypothetical protein